MSKTNALKSIHDQLNHDEIVNWQNNRNDQKMEYLYVKHSNHILKCFLRFIILLIIIILLFIFFNEQSTTYCNINYKRNELYMVLIKLRGRREKCGKHLIMSLSILPLDVLQREPGAELEIKHDANHNTEGTPARGESDFREYEKRIPLRSVKLVPRIEGTLNQPRVRLELSRQIIPGIG